MSIKKKVSKIEYEETISEEIGAKGFSFVTRKILEERVKKTEINSIISALNKTTYKIGEHEYRVEKVDRGRPLGTAYIVYDEAKVVPVSVSSVSDFLQNVYKYNDKKVSRYFRGQKAHYDLKPSLFRGKGKYIEKEMELNARVYNDRPKDFADCNSTFEKLVKLKHYVHPSRLFDLSSSPLVALFFACFSSSDEGKDDVGVIVEAYCRKEDEKYSVSSDTIVMLTAMTNTKISASKRSKAIPCLKIDEHRTGKDGEHVCPVKKSKESCFKSCWAKEDNKKKKEKDEESGGSEEEKPEKKDMLGNGWALDYIDELSHQCKKEGMTIYWDDVCFNELNQCILVHPPLNNDRIVRQQGCFIMCGMNPVDIYEPPKSLYDFFKYPENGGQKDWKARLYYISSSSKKNDILKELEVLGMDEYYFFPELEREIKVVSSSVEKSETSKETKPGKKTAGKKSGKDEKKGASKNSPKP